MPDIEIVLGVTGGIAAYKAAEIVRGVRREGGRITVVMTAHAHEFITPLTLETLSGRRVITSHFDAVAAGAEAEDVEHIGLARGCHLLLVAPATANVLAKLACGIADDFLSTFALTVTCPLMVAPAMNTRMWEHPTVVENLERLRRRGAHVVEPEIGPLASPGEGIGVGRLAHPDTIVARAMEVARSHAGATHGPRLRGHVVLVTAGPTREEIDPVRFLSSPSTGKMGFAVAEAARDLGAAVILVSGPTHLPDPAGIEMVRVTSAEQMREAVMANLERASVVVMTAAVSDFRPASRAPGKIKKESAPREMALQRTPDILAEIGKVKGSRFLVGFAAETEELSRNARRKLEDKNLDLVVANIVAAPDGPGPNGAFGSDDNEVVVIDRLGNEDRWPRLSKRQVASRLMTLVAAKVAGKASAG